MKKNITGMMCLLIFPVLILFLLSIFPLSSREGFTDRRSCPNMLIKKGDTLELHFRDGKDPVEFNNLDEYTDFIAWQRSKNIRCPILYLEPVLDTQGDTSYRVSDNPYQGDVYPTLIQGNTKIPKAFDPNSFSVGFLDLIDKLFVSSDSVSDNPMDTHWGGQQHTRNAIKAGEYDGSKIYRMAGQQYDSIRKMKNAS